ncbi:hypothetical protein [Mesorhizobium qingshengii]|uniref:Uncharacterized protein n=1 Tax=Mesorhizobium qingshengii TaxID=1165689 RepID=A0A1G5XYQ5_9HYPH|nr:hypothetical protein [Mesorhizobium qingshengii]SDA74964.1 hypothetical protein SAMN02927914_02689 [Mesorhizobium qingshengii]
MTPHAAISSRAPSYIRRALPGWRTALFGALLWAMSMGASVLVNLDAWETPEKIRTVSMLFASGGALAFPVGLFAARLVSLGRHWEVAFAAAFVCLAAATIGLTGGLFALQYRSYYAEWHAPAFTLTWAFQFVFTTLVALYQFVVLGIRLYFPTGFVALFAASVWFARQRR